MKDFDDWNRVKKNINDRKTQRFYHERDIWWCSLGLNIGYEQDGKDGDYQRPVLILKGISLKTCLVIPLTTSATKHPMRLDIGCVTGKNSKVIVSQIRTIDTKRLINKIGVLNQARFDQIRKVIKDFL